MDNLIWVAYSSGYLIFAILFLLIGKKFFDLLTPYSVNVQLTEKDNHAVGILVIGFLLGLTAIICGVFIGEGLEVPSWQAFAEEIVPVGVYGLIGMVLLFVAGIVNDKVILHKFSNQKEIIESSNSAVALVMASAYLGSGLIIAGSINGCINVISLVALVALGLLALMIFAVIYQLMTSYDDQKELGDNKNVAAGIAYAGNVIAYSLILMKGLSMKPESLENWVWSDRLLHFAYYAIAGIILLIITRKINDLLFLPGAKISKEIVEDQNLNAGFMEFGLALAMGSAMVFCL